MVRAGALALAACALVLLSAVSTALRWMPAPVGLTITRSVVIAPVAQAPVRTTTALWMRRKGDPRKTSDLVPRKLKRRMRSLTAANLTSLLTLEVDDYLRFNATGKVKESIMKTLHRVARAANVSIEPTFGVADTPHRPTLLESIRANRTCETFAKLVSAAAEESALLESALATVLVPTDSAMLTLDPAVLQELLATPEQALTFVRRHVLAGVFSAKKLGTLPADQLPTPLSGTTLRVSAVKDTAELRIGSATVVHRDERASNGLAHFLDQPLT